MRVRVVDIKIGNRVRRDAGDLSELVESMRRLGLLQPVVIDADNRLIAGFRRLQAARELGWESIEARLVDVQDQKERILMEVDENVVRREFSPDEMDRVDRLLHRYSRSGIFWRLVNWFLDLLDRIFGR
ncbi:MAG: ParB N-terminal domain-containing protein [Leptospirales bacterium]|nr:ParB N-terminal domain-containing protein [Leptospirales bacterium]